MSDFVLTTASCEALGHPTECTEPAPGSVVSESSSSVTINGTDIATTATADIDFPSHSHDYDSLNGCQQDSSHTLDPTNVSSSVTLNGNPLYIEESAVASDPITGGDINILDAGGNTSVSES